MTDAIFCMAVGLYFEARAEKQAKAVAPKAKAKAKKVSAAK